MLVSVFSDGSFCPHKFVGGWGAFVKSNRGHLFKGGPLRGKILHSNEAETLAAANAIAIAIASKLAVGGDRILLQSDCKYTLEILTLVGRSGSKKCKKAKNLIERLLRENGITLRTRHVRGHQKSLEPRFKVNNICDELARKGMEEMRKKHA